MRALFLVLLVGAILSAPASGQIFRWLAFGDSITEAWSDTAFLGGYPGRLESDLNCTPSTCEVVNKGQSFETAAEGVTRFETVMNNTGPYDVAFIMEGTNDIWGPNNINNVSIPTILFNLNAMAIKAEARGTEAVPTSIIWLYPGAHPRNSPRNPLVQDLRNQLQSSASTNSRLFVDQWSILCPGGQTSCFTQHYWHNPDNGLPDSVGHPDASGFRQMTDEFFSRINATPIPGPATPTSPSGGIGDNTPTLTWTIGSSVGASWYQVRVTGPGGTPFQAWIKASQACSGANSGNTCSTDVISPLNDDSYNWQVMSRNARGRSGWSNQMSFTVGASTIFNDGFESGNSSAWSETSP